MVGVGDECGSDGVVAFAMGSCSMSSRMDNDDVPPFCPEAVPLFCPGSAVTAMMVVDFNPGDDGGSTMASLARPGLGLGPRLGLGLRPGLGLGLG